MPSMNPACLRVGTGWVGLPRARSVEAFLEVPEEAAISHCPQGLHYTTGLKRDGGDFVGMCVFFNCGEMHTL